MTFEAKQTEGSIAYQKAWKYKLAAGSLTEETYGQGGLFIFDKTVWNPSDCWSSIRELLEHPRSCLLRWSVDGRQMGSFAEVSHENVLRQPE